MADRFVIEVCRNCGGLVNWNARDDGGCLGGTAWCDKREPGSTEFVVVRRTAERPRDAELPYYSRRASARSCMRAQHG